MNNQPKLRKISILMLFVFLFFKVGIVHAISHSVSHDTHHDCEQCATLVDTTKTKSSQDFFLDNSSIEFTTYTVDVSIEIIATFSFVNNSFTTVFLNKPPPFI